VLLAIPVSITGIFFKLIFMKQFLFVLAVSVLLAGCTGHTKKILIYASSDIQVDNTQKNITVTDGTTQEEKELEFTGKDPVVLNIQSPAGKFSLEASDDGYYVANLKMDTVLGSLQHIGADTGNGKITQDQLKKIIDSLQQLTMGKNISPANKNYFIPPGKIVKISDQTKVKIFGPYTKIPASFDASNTPEVFKFYTIKEVRETMDKLPAMTKF
jgi:hypothetical protein